MAEDSTELCASLRRIADTVETNGGWRIAAIKIRGAVEEIDKLRCVALAARALVQSAETLPSGLDYSQQIVSEPALTALESALEAAGYGMSEEEAADG